VAVERRIDLYKASFWLAGRMRAFGAIKPEFPAQVVERDRRIVSASAGAQKKIPVSRYSISSILRRLRGSPCPVPWRHSCNGQTWPPPYISRQWTFLVIPLGQGPRMANRGGPGTEWAVSPVQI
jgi:hypothetical protein